MATAANLASVLGLLCSAAVLPQPLPPPCQSTAVQLSRRAALASLVLLPTRAALAAAEDLTQPTVNSESGDVMHGLLQSSAPVPLPPGGSAVVTMRVVGRNTKGPLAKMTLPLTEGMKLPLPFALDRSSFREGVVDFLWEAEDLYVFTEILAPSGKSIAVGRSKAKAIDVGGRPGHGVAFVNLE